MGIKLFLRFRNFCFFFPLKSSSQRLKSSPWNAASNCNDFSTADNSPPIIAPTATTTVAKNTDANRKSYILFAAHWTGIDTGVGEGHTIRLQTFTRSMVVAFFAFFRHRVSSSFAAVYFNFSNTAYKQFNIPTHARVSTDKATFMINLLLLTHPERTATNRYFISYYSASEAKIKNPRKKLPPVGWNGETTTLLPSRCYERLATV